MSQHLGLQPAPQPVDSALRSPDSRSAIGCNNHLFWRARLRGDPALRHALRRQHAADAVILASQLAARWEQQLRDLFDEATLRDSAWCRVDQLALNGPASPEFIGALTRKLTVGPEGTRRVRACWRTPDRHGALPLGVHLLARVVGQPSLGRVALLGLTARMQRSGDDLP